MIKIFVAYHIPARLINDPNFCPIHVGRALTMSTKDGDSTNKNRQWLLENCIGDDTGINISHLNRQYCELTGIFWVWKNINKYQDAEYIGFMHYRRHLRFNNQKAKEDKYGQIIYDKFKEALQKPLFPSRIEQNCSVRFFFTTSKKWCFFCH